MQYLDIKLSEETNAQWLHINKHIYRYMKKEYKNKFNITQILIHIKKIYNIPPIRLKTDTSKHTLNIRDFTLYILLKYSSENSQKISNEFGITIDQVQSIKNNKMLTIKYRRKEIIYLNFLKKDYLLNRGPFKNLCQSGKITNTQGHRNEYRNRCRAVCS